MEITLRLSDEVIHQLQQLPNPDEFVSEVLKKALSRTSDQKEPSSPRPSKWARIAKRIEEDPVHLAGYSKQLQEDMREFRENLALMQDK